MHTNANVIRYTSTHIFQFPFTILEPTIVDDIIDGNLAKLDIIRNDIGETGNSPPTYINKSFGVPGIKNKKNNIVSILLVFLNILDSKNLSTFFLLKKK